MPKRRPGRPAIPDERRRKKGVNVRLTWDEHRRAKRAAEADDITVSSWIRALVLTALQRGGTR